MSHELAPLVSRITHRSDKTLPHPSLRMYAFKNKITWFDANYRISSHAFPSFFMQGVGNISTTMICIRVLEQETNLETEFIVDNKGVSSVHGPMLFPVQLQQGFEKEGKVARPEETAVALRAFLDNHKLTRFNAARQFQPD